MIKQKLIKRSILTSLILFLFVFSTGISIAQKFAVEVEKKQMTNFYDIKKSVNEYWKNVPKKQRRGWKQYKRWENFWEERLYPTGEFPNAIKIAQEIDFFNQQHKKDKSNKTLAFDWTILGPETRPGSTDDARGQGLGRINVVRFHPTDNNNIWVGTASGGVWRSTDGGETWAPFPFTQFMAITISDIAICPSNPDIVYVATGDANGSFSTSGTYYSIGVIKTTDAGATWNTTGISNNMDDSRLYARILVDPENPDVVIVGSNQGVYKSTDGGANFEQTANGYFKDMEFKPDNKNIIYATTFDNSNGHAAIYKSTNMGDSFTKILQDGDLQGANRIALAVTPANPDNVYALASTLGDDCFHSFWVSNDAGDNYDMWANTESTGNILGRYDGDKDTDDLTAGQGWYDLCIAVDPDDEDVIFTGGINIWRSEDGGGYFEKYTHWQEDGNAFFVHADHHDLMYQNNSEILFGVHDGGISKTTDGGETWIDLTNGLSITQFYRLSCSVTNSNLILAGAQDNGTSLYDDGTWTHVAAGDGMDCAIDPTNPKYMYCSQPNGVIQRSENSGNSFDFALNDYFTGTEGAWVTPIAVDHQNGKRVYAGYDEIWVSADYGKYGTWNKLTDNINATWAKIKTIVLAPSNSNVIYASSNNKIYKTSDVNTTDFTSLQSYASQSITGIAVDPADPDRIWVSESGYNENHKVVYYDGESWTNISGNLPNVPVNCIVYQPESPDRIYIGTDIGVFYSQSNTGQWQKFGSGLPNVIVSDIEIQKNVNKLRIATYGRGLWENNLIMSNIEAPEITIYGDTEFCDGDSVTLEAPEGFVSYEWSNGETTRSIVVTESGDFYVTVEDEDGNTAVSKTVEILVNYVPEYTVNIEGTYPLCEGDEFEYVTFTGPITFKDYQWSNGGTDRSITVEETGGTYYFTATAPNGCPVESEHYVVDFNPPPDKPEITVKGTILTSTEAEGYIWYKDGDLLEDETRQKVDAKDHGIGKYKVTIQDENGCENTSDEVDITSDVEDNSELSNSISVHPNPTSGIFNLEFEANFMNIEVKITNSIGKEVYVKNFSHEGGMFNQVMDLSGMVNGVYFININLDGNVVVKKIVKE